MDKEKQLAEEFVGRYVELIREHFVRNTNDEGLALKINEMLGVYDTYRVKGPVYGDMAIAALHTVNSIIKHETSPKDLEPYVSDLVQIQQEAEKQGLKPPPTQVVEGVMIRL